MKLTSDLMVGFAVVSLFTLVPLRESIELLKPLFISDMVELFEFALTSSYFLYGDKFYEQSNVVVMGSLVSPVKANSYMETFEHSVL